MSGEKADNVKFKNVETEYSQNLLSILGAGNYYSDQWPVAQDYFDQSYFANSNHNNKMKYEGLSNTALVILKWDSQVMGAPGWILQTANGITNPLTLFYSHDDTTDPVQAKNWYYLPKGAQTRNGEQVRARLMRLGYAREDVLTFQIRGAQNYWNWGEWQLHKWFYGKQYFVNGMQNNRYKFCV